MPNLHLKTWNEIETIIFEGASVSEPRSISDRLSDDEILSLIDHPAFDMWSTSAKDWVWNAVECAAFE